MMRKASCKASTVSLKCLLDTTSQKGHVVHKLWWSGWGHPAAAAAAVTVASSSSSLRPSPQNETKAGKVKILDNIMVLLLPQKVGTTWSFRGMWKVQYGYYYTTSVLLTFFKFLIKSFFRSVVKEASVSSWLLQSQFYNYIHYTHSCSTYYTGKPEMTTTNTTSRKSGLGHLLDWPLVHSSGWSPLR